MSTPVRPPPGPSTGAGAGAGRPPAAITPQQTDGQSRPPASAAGPAGGGGPLPRPPMPQQQQQQQRPPGFQQNQQQQQQRPPTSQQGGAVRPGMPQQSGRPNHPQMQGGPSAVRPTLSMGSGGQARPPPPVGQQGGPFQQQQPVKPPPKTKKERDRERDREKERERARERERERMLEKEVAPGPFAASLGRMMYGFGDEETPSNDTVHVMEDLLGHFITDLCTLPPLPATHATTKARQVTFSHLHHQLGSHPASRPLLHRLEELAILQKDIKEARKTMDPTFSTGMGSAGGQGEDDGAGGLLGVLGPGGGVKKRGTGATAAPSKKKKRPNEGD